jgi:hypothetical protein
MLHKEERKNKMHTYLFWKDVDRYYFHVRESCTCRQIKLTEARCGILSYDKIFTQIGVIDLSVGGKE